MVDIKAIREARKGTKFRDLSQVDALARISEIIGRCYLINGQVKYNDKDIIIIAKEVHTQMMAKFFDATPEELELACTDAIYSGTSKFSISPASITQWFQAYRDSDNYISVKRNEERKYIPTDAAQIEDKSKTPEAVAREMLENDFNSLLSGRKAFRFATPRGTFVYDYLVKTGRIHESDWKENLERARELKTRRSKSNKFCDFISEDVSEDVLAKAITSLEYVKAAVAKKSAELSTLQDLPE